MIAREVGKEGEREKEREGGGRKRRRGERKGIDTCRERERGIVNVWTYKHMYMYICHCYPGSYTRQKERHMKMLKHRKSSSGHREDDPAAQKVLKVCE